MCKALMTGPTSQPHLWTSSSDLFRSLQHVLLLQALGWFALHTLSTIFPTTYSLAFLLPTIYVLPWMGVWTNCFNAFAWDISTEAGKILLNLRNIQHKGTEFLEDPCPWHLVSDLNYFIYTPLTIWNGLSFSLPIQIYSSLKIQVMYKIFYETFPKFSYPYQLC